MITGHELVPLEDRNPSIAVAGHGSMSPVFEDKYNAVDNQLHLGNVVAEVKFKSSMYKISFINITFIILHNVSMHQKIFKIIQKVYNDYYNDKMETSS